VAASPFPRHSLYDSDGRLVGEHGLDNVDEWYRETLAESPWDGGALEDELDRVVLAGGATPTRRRLGRGETLVEQSDVGTDMFLLLEGVLQVEIDGETVAEVGSGAVLGELAILGDGRRTATLRAIGPARVAVLTAADVPGSRLAELTARARVA
jgi:hypothetical protein